MNARSHIKFCALCLALVSTAACATKQPEPVMEPAPQSIRLRDPQKVPPGGVTTIDQTIQKDLFNIRLSNNGISVNGTKVENQAALEALLSKYPKPVITISSHRCYDGEKAAAIMNLAQTYTNTPIAFGSFGDFSDPECQ